MTRRQETVALASLLGVWLAANLATLGRSPTVWHDEVMFAEPAVRFLSGQGFTATSWPAPAGIPAILNGPLYSALLIPWFRLFGVGPVAGRSLGLVLAGLTGVLLWRVAVETGFVAGAALRVAGVGVFLCGSGVAWGYRSGRYDSLGMLLVTSVGAVLVHEVAGAGGAACGGAGPGARRARGLWLAAFLAAGIPFAGLHLLPYCLAAAGVALAAGGRRWRWGVASALGGLAVGCVALAALHWRLGTWAEMAAFVASQRGSLADRVAGLPAALRRDPSTVPLAGFLLGHLVVCPRGPGRRSAWAGVAAAVLVPVCMAVAGRYPPYYGWMAYTPVLALALRVLGGHTSERGAGPGRQALSRGAGVLALAMAAGTGLPVRLAVCAMEWQQRDYALVEHLAQEWLRPEDVVLAGSEAYYAVRRRCREVVLAAGTLRSAGGIPSEVTALVGGLGLTAEELDSPPDPAYWVQVASCTPPAYSLPVRLGRARWYAVSVWRRR